MKAAVRLMFPAMVAGVITLYTGMMSWAQEYSHVRIVRLSFAEGPVTVQRSNAGEWATAPVNTPIQEGFKLATGENGFVEVEFENASTVRLGQLSLLEFTQLALMPSGGKVNRMILHQGYGTFNVLPEGDDIYEIKAGNATFTPQGKTRFRADLEEGLLQVKVFRGSVEILSPEGTGTLGKNTVLEVRPGTAEPFQLSQGISKDAWDEWVEKREERVELVRSQGPPAPYYSNRASDLLYGFMDLMFYGNWVSLPGYGYGWTPSVDFGWSPYTLGRWCWYPGFGYTWISSEPWGWLPYHYGTWTYQPGIGWCWLPGSFNTWSPAMVNWYQGPGWVGWAPASPLLGGGQYNCPQARGCVTTVAEDTFRNGRPVAPNRLGGIDPRDGRQTDRPEIPPERLAMLPGSPSLEAASSRNPRDTEQAGRARPETSGPAGRADSVPAAATAEGRAPSARPVSEAAGNRGARQAESGIVFDPTQRRFVNASGRSSGGEAPESAQITSPGDTQGEQPRATSSSSRAARPGPQEVFLVPPTSRSFDATIRPDDRSFSTRGASRPDWFESRTGTATRNDSSARSVPSRSGDRSSSSLSSSRGGASVGHRSEAGSAGRSSSERGSWSSGGGRTSGDSGGGGSRSPAGAGSSSHSTGGWGGSSGGSSHGVGGGSSPGGGGYGGGSHGSSAGGGARSGSGRH